MGENFIIPLSGLANGQTDFSWKTGKEFFESFENSEILDAELVASVIVEKSGRYVGVDCTVSGRLVVECDRCLEELVLPVDLEVKLSVKFGDVDESDENQDGEREVIFLPVDNTELDMKQIVYDYVCISLPIQRVHEDGDCNPDTLRYLEPQSASGSSEIEDENNPFAALKGLF